MSLLSSWPCLICTGLRGFVSGFLGWRRSSDVSYLVKCGVLVGESIFCRGMGGLGTGARQEIVSIGDLDRVGEVLGDGHEGEQLIGVHGVGKEVVIWPSSILAPSTGAVGGGQPGCCSGMSGLGSALGKDMAELWVGAGVERDDER